MTHSPKTTSLSLGAIRPAVRRGLFLLLFLSASAAAVPAQNFQDAPTLEPGKPIERELAGGQSHSYRFTINAGQYSRVVVEQRGVDVVVVLYAPDGKKLVERDSPNGKQGPETISFEAETGGTYRIEVKTLETDIAPGRYEIRIEQPHTATPQDKARINAERSFAEAQKLDKQGTPDASRMALTKYEEARGEWQKSGDTYWQSLAMEYVVGLYKSLNERQKLLDYLEQMRQVWQAAADREVESRVLAELGYQYIDSRDFQKALGYLQQSLALKKAANVPLEELTSVFSAIAGSYLSLGDRQAALKTLNEELEFYRGAGNRGLQAYALSEMATFYGILGQYQQALDTDRQALSLCREVGDRACEVRALNDIGSTYYRLGEMSKALEAENQTLALARLIDDRPHELEALAGLANVFRTTGEIQKALDANQQALELVRKVGDKTVEDRKMEAALLLNIGNIYSDIGEDQKALDALNQSLPIWLEINHTVGEAFTRNALGGVYESLGDHQKALAFSTEAASLFEKVGDHASEATALQNIGAIYGQLGDHEKAVTYYQKALPLVQNAGERAGEAHILDNLGVEYVGWEVQKGLDSLNRALVLYRAIGDRSGEARALHNIAVAEAGAGHTDEALKDIESSLAIIEDLRTKIAGQELRSSYFATVQDYYELYVDLLMRLHKQQPDAGYDGRALQASERGRARGLLELLSEAGADIRQGVDPQLVGRERALQKQLNASAQQQVKLLSGPHTEAQAAAVAKEIENLITEFQQVEAQIRQASPRYAALTQPPPLTLKEIQTEVLDTDTLLLEYSLGEERSYLWAVTPTSVRSYELPTRGEVEAAARAVYALFSSEQRWAESRGQRGTEIVGANGPASDAAARLSRMLLAPVASQLGRKRLLVVGDGALQFIPFGALPAPAASGDKAASDDKKDSYQPLIVEHEVVSLPSASALAVLRREAKNRQPAARTLAVLADPVFESTDVRIKSPASKAVAVTDAKLADAGEKRGMPSALAESARESGLRVNGLTLPRLPGTRDEAQHILSLVPPDQGKQALDFAASRETATGADMSQYRFVHFATHGFINSLHPELSGIALSMFDERGTPRDGFLRLNDIFNLKLSADMVVLSACQTGLGKEIRGEGLVGLTRGFMYAGTPRVVVSLWSVSDEATAELMTRFYKGVLADKLRPAQALQAAQVSMLKDKRYGAPFYWAAFTLQGEWR